MIDKLTYRGGLAGRLQSTLFAIALLLGAELASADDPGVSRQIVVALHARTDLDAVRQAYSLGVIRRLGVRPLYLLRTPRGTDIPALLARLSSDARIAFAEPNFVVFEPEARRRAVWTIGSAGAYTRQWAPRHLRLPEAHDFATGNGVAVAVIDTGVDVAHPALTERLLPGYDFVDRDTDPSEVGVIGDYGYGHGTHVAGLVAIAAPGARILPLRALDARGRGTIFTVAEALFHAADPDGDPSTPDHARVINLSLGTTSPTQLLDKVVELVTCSDDDDDEDDDDYSDPGYAADLERCDLHHGSVVVAAAGNGGSATQLMFPAAERAEGALAVTASTARDALATFSNRGPWVQIAAPGKGLTSTVPGGGYGVWSGTSMAAPLVAGLAALVLEVNPDWKPVDVTKRLEDRSAALCGTWLRRIDVHGAVFDEDPAETTCP
jgi:subtilisin family serine protease